MSFGLRVIGSLITAATIVGMFVIQDVAHGDSIVDSKHDLTTTFEPYSDQVCAFCHTPHGANPDIPNAPLWNRFVDLNQTYTVYSSPTMDTSPGQPNVVPSVLCLGCHDGTSGSAVVNTITGSTKHDLINAPGPGGTPDTTSYPNCRNCHGEMYGDPPAFWQGTDLSDDHPIAMVYPTAAQDSAFLPPPDPLNGWLTVPLYQGRIECSSCHDVHDPAITPFLRISNDDSVLCVTCHVK
ncbi:MAG: hypothetical protein GY906_27030 [bacterium]|nr:hypothetical protein [bacterium]